MRAHERVPDDELVTVRWTLERPGRVRAGTGVPGRRDKPDREPSRSGAVDAPPAWCGWFAGPLP